MSSTRKVAAAAAVATFALTGCSFEFSASTGGGVHVKQAEVEEKIAAMIEEQTGIIATVACPDDLPGEVGTKMQCEATSDTEPEPLQVEATVNSVNDDTVNFTVLPVED